MLPRASMLTTKNGVALGLLALLILTGLLAGCRPPGARALLEGRRLLVAGDATNAVRRFQAAAALLPTNAAAWNYLGLACHRAGQVTNSIRAYQKALSLAPDLSEARFNLGCLWMEQNAFDQARAEFTAYTLRYPNRVEGWLKLGFVDFRLRDGAAAEKSYREALRVDPKNLQAYNGLGLAALLRNRPRDAAQHFAAAAQAKPAYRPALLNLAITLQHYLRDRTRALECYHQYLALTPKAADWNSVNAAAQALEQELARAAASSVTNQITVAPPQPAKPSTNALPRSVAPAPKPEPAIELIKPPVIVKSAPGPTQTVVVTSPPEIRTIPIVAAPPVVTSPPPQATTVSSPETETRPQPATMEEVPNTIETGTEPKKRSLVQRLNPLNLFKRSPKPVAGPTPLPAPKDSANAPPEKGPTVPPSEVAPSKTAAIRAQESQKPIPRYAYRAPLRPVEGNRREAERQFSKGVKAHSAGKWAEAVSAYRAALQADPTHFEACYNLGVAAEQAGNLAESLAAYENALAIQPDSVNARYNFALCLKRGGYFLDAAAELEQILALHASDARTRLALANLYAQQLRQPDKARGHYNKLLELDPRHPQADAIRHWLVQNPE